MPYYGAGDYYTGDNYAAGGGIFSSIGKVVSKVGKAVIRATPIGAVASSLIPSFNPPPPGGRMKIQIPEPGITGAVHRLAPGGHPGYGHYTKSGHFTDRKRPRMNPTNVHALRRAGRRLKSFLKIARRLGALPVGGSGKKLFKAHRRRK